MITVRANVKNFNCFGFSGRTGYRIGAVACFKEAFAFNRICNHTGCRIIWLSPRRRIVLCKGLIDTGIVIAVEEVKVEDALAGGGTVGSVESKADEIRDISGVDIVAYSAFSHALLILLPSLPG